MAAFLASEQCVDLGVVSLSHRTAVGTPLGRVPRVNDVQHNSFVKASGYQVRLDLVERHPENLFIEVLAFPIKPPQQFNGDVRIILECKIDDVSNDLADSVPNEVAFVASRFAELLLGRAAFGIGIRLERTPPLEDAPPPLPDVLSEI